MAKRNPLDLDTLDAYVEEFLPPGVREEDGSSSSRRSSSDSSEDDTDKDDSGPDYIPRSEAKKLAASFAKDKDLTRLEAFADRSIRSENGRRLAEWKLSRTKVKFGRLAEAMKTRHEGIKGEAGRIAEKYGLLLEASDEMRQTHQMLKRRSVVAEALRLVKVPDALRARVVRTLAEAPTRETLLAGIAQAKTRYGSYGEAAPAPAAEEIEQPRAPRPRVPAPVTEGAPPVRPALRLVEDKTRVAGGETRAIKLFEAAKRYGHLR